jgi:preprotein translocase subunit SecA
LLKSADTNNGETNDAGLVEVFALANEAIRRSLGVVPFDEQLLTGLILHKGHLA